jgi:iron complex transport system substrate-binding protein
LLVVNLTIIERLHGGNWIGRFFICLSHCDSAVRSGSAIPPRIAIHRKESSRDTPDLPNAKIAYAGNEVLQVIFSRVERRIAAVKKRTQSLAHPRVLYVLNTDPLQTVGPGSFIHQLIEAAGGANIAADTSTAYPRFALEEVLARDPELIVFPVGTAEGIPEDDQQQWRRWSSLSAVKHNRLVLMPSVLVDRPGPRIVEGLELLAKAIHPEAFTGESEEEKP